MASTGQEGLPSGAGHLTQQELEARLWDAANSLRGPVDPADFKAYVFPLLFFKWISDTWDMEHSEAMADRTWSLGWGMRKIAGVPQWIPPISRLTSSHCCSSNGLATPGTWSTPKLWLISAITSTSWWRLTTTALRSQRAAIGLIFA